MRAGVDGWCTLAANFAGGELTLFPQTTLDHPSLPSLRPLPFLSLTLDRMSHVAGNPALATARLWHHVSAENRTVGQWARV